MSTYLERRPGLISHVMRAVRCTLIVAIAVLSLGLLTVGPSVRTSAAARAGCAGADMSGGSSARRLHVVSCLVEAARRAVGVHRLELDPRLARSAAAKARDIARCRRFAHAPCDESWATGMRRAGYRRGRSRIAENLAWLSRGTPRQLLRLWLESPAHRANLLHPRYRATGLARRMVRLPAVGVVEVWVQQFGARD